MADDRRDAEPGPPRRPTLPRADPPLRRAPRLGPRRGDPEEAAADRSAPMSPEDPPPPDEDPGPPAGAALEDPPDEPATIPHGLLVGVGSVTDPATAPPAPSPTPPHLRAAPGPAPPDPSPTPRPPAAPPPGRARTVAAGETDWAATSTVIAALRARLRARRRPWTPVRVLRLATASAAVLVVLVTGIAWGATSWLEAAIRQIGALDPTSTAIVDAAAQRGDQNFLVVGSDTRVGAPPSEEVGNTTDIPGARSDTVMIVHVPGDRSRVTVVSFPRDLEIDRPACHRWDPVSGRYSPEVVGRTPRVKLNTAYETGGPLCVTKAVQELSGLAVNHFLGVDFQGFKEMVDAVGGVSICLEGPVRDSVLGVIADRAGPTRLTGDQALAFVRARHVEGDPTSDYGRIQRQQRFLGALLRETLSAGTLLDVGRLRGLVDAVARSTFGENVGADQLLVLGRSLGSLDPRAVTFTSVPTTGIANGRGNEVLRPVEDRALFSAVIANRPLPGEPGAVDTTVPPDQVVVRLARAGAAEDDSGAAAVRRSGVTRDVGTALRAQGFRVVLDPTAALPSLGPTGTADAADGSGRAVIRFSPDLAAAAATLGRSIRGATMAPADGVGQLALSLGRGVEGADGLVVAPGPVPPTPVAPTITAADPPCA